MRYLRARGRGRRRGRGAKQRTERRQFHASPPSINNTQSFWPETLCRQSQACDSCTAAPPIGADVMRSPQRWELRSAGRGPDECARGEWRGVGDAWAVNGCARLSEELRICFRTTHIHFCSSTSSRGGMQGRRKAKDDGWGSVHDARLLYDSPVSNKSRACNCNTRRRLWARR